MNIFGRKNKDKKDASGQGSGKSGHVNSLVTKSRQVLGVPLKEAIKNSKSFDGQPVPAIVRECIDYVTLAGIRQEGIYRVSSPKSRLDELESMVNSGRENDILFQDAHEAAGLLKRFLRQLPEHIFTSALKSRFEDTASNCTCNNQHCCTCPVVDHLKELLMQLPIENFYLLGYVFRHAQLCIQQEGSNKMGLAALGVLLQAMLNLSRNIVRIFILNATDLLYPESEHKKITQLFDSIETNTYRKPKSVEELKQRPPETRKELEDEIFKQQNLLAHLHERVQEMRFEGDEDVKAKEEEMWAVQQTITNLKRHQKAIQEQDNEALEQQKFQEDGEVGIGPSGEQSQTTAVSSTLLEKQLWAIQMSLREEIGEEKRLIGHLLSVLRELKSQLSAEGRNKPPIVGLHSNNNKPLASPTPSLVSSTNFDEQCAVEEERKEDLLSELVHYRNICAQLRARLEHETVRMKFATTTAIPMVAATVAAADGGAADTLQSNQSNPALLITRF